MSDEWCWTFKPMKEEREAFNFAGDVFLVAGLITLVVLLCQI